uniref:Grimp protein n=1 Tax=Enchytraeus japonensis TaxID=228735 RepID=E1CB71_9ANNE|nr:grimp [Enchytraeus japonensis]
MELTSIITLRGDSIAWTRFMLAVVQMDGSILLYIDPTQSSSITGRGDSTVWTRSMLVVEKRISIITLRGDSTAWIRSMLVVNRCTGQSAAALTHISENCFKTIMREHPLFQHSMTSYHNCQDQQSVWTIRASGPSERQAVQRQGRHDHHRQLYHHREDQSTSSGSSSSSELRFISVLAVH